MIPTLSVPEGYLETRRGRRSVVFAADLGHSLERLGFLDGSPREEPLEQLCGRATHRVYRLPEDGRAVLWKRCGRGGWAEPVLRDLHFGHRRFLRELAVTEAARRDGLPVARILAVAWQQLGAGWARAELLCEVVSGARDGAEALRLPAGPRRAELLRAAARTLRRFHGLGYLHGDLNVRNLLWRWQDQRAAITLIDLDPARAPRGPVRDGPRANLLRLARSYVKGARRGDWWLSRVDRYRFLDGYFRGDRIGIHDFLRRAARRPRLALGTRPPASRGDA